MHTLSERRLPLLTVTLVIATTAAIANEPVVEFSVTGATHLAMGQPLQFEVTRDALGSGIAGCALWRGRDELRYPLRDVPEGDYILGLAVRTENYTSFGEILPFRMQLYLNDTRVAVVGHTEPIRPQGLPSKVYVAELRTPPLRVKPGDIFRVVSSHCFFLAGPLRLYRQPPDERLVWTAPPVPAPDLEPPEVWWLLAQWGPEQYARETITQAVVLSNCGVRPHTVRVEVAARDYLLTDLLTQHTSLTLAPGQTLTNTYSFPRGHGPRTRLTLTASAPDLYPPVRLSKFWTCDRTTGPRPTFDLCGPWQMCWVPAVEPGTKPPADAAWLPLNVPNSTQVTNAHCAWFRRVFVAPPHLRGDRILLHCDALPSEAWLYLNGQAVGYQRHGALPFELDVTAGFKPGQTNELLVAARDWIAYSPANQERVRNGEAPVFKDDMLDVCDYPEFTGIGPTAPLRLEGRPAVSIDDVAIVTSVRHKRLSLTYRLLNTAATDQTVTLSARVLGGGEPVKTLPRHTVTIPAGSNRTVTLEHSWRSPRYWSPDDPHLYVLESTLTTGSETADRRWDRCGFRETCFAGRYLMLNGIPVKLRATCIGMTGASQARHLSDPAQRYAAIWDWQVRWQCDGAMQLARTHLGSRLPEALELADETGLLLQVEGEAHQVAFTLDERFWEAVERHEVRLVDTFKNHASVILWSAGNENMWGGAYQGELVGAAGRSDRDPPPHGAHHARRQASFGRRGVLAGEPEPSLRTFCLDRRRHLRGGAVRVPCLVGLIALLSARTARYRGLLHCAHEPLAPAPAAAGRTQGGDRGVLRRPDDRAACQCPQ